MPAASDRPSGLNATVFTQLTAPVSVPSRTARPAPTRHSQTLKSLLEAASSFPSGLNATPETESAGPVNGMPGSAAGASPAARAAAPGRCHSQTVPALCLPRASARPG